MEVVITGIGLRSSLGDLETSWRRLCQNQTAIAPQSIFPDLPTLPIALIGEQPQSLNTLVGPILQDALRSGGLELPLTDCGVAIGSSRGHQAEWEQLRRSPGNLSNWLTHLPAMTAAQVAANIGTLGPVSAPMAACATSIWAIAQGYEWIRTGRCSIAVVGAVEAPITPLTLASFQRMGALAKTGCYPFDRDREGLVLSEGGAIFILESRQHAQQRQANIWGVLQGFGFTTDAHHVSAPEPTGKMAHRAVLECLQRSQLTPQEINYIHAHGTSTQRNDRLESQLVRQVWGQNTTVALSSTKGATGHTLGASGALGLAFTLLAFRDQRSPPCVGLKTLEFPINCVRQATSGQLRHALVLSFGFGGQNTVLAVSRPN